MSSLSSLRVLHMTSELDGGGVDRILYDYSTRMLPDIKSDFLVSSSNRGILEAPLEDMGCHVFHIPKIRDGLANRREVTERIISEGRYDVVHDHSGYKAGFLLASAKRLGVPCRIAHAHIAKVPESAVARIKRACVTSYTVRNATHLFACGKDAARWMWGNKRFDCGDVHVMPIAIDTDKFQFSEAVREEVRQELGIGDALVIGNVARFSTQKNHKRLLSIFAAVRRIRSDVILLLIGRGELFEEIKALSMSMGFGDSVKFLGVRNDVPRLLNAMDVFLLPSLYEGLPVSLIEVQANGLPMVTSEVVTNEALLLPTSCTLPLSATDDAWALRILSASNCARVSGDSVVLLHDIKRCSFEQRDWYIEHVK